jgi:alcohol dehydrogenase, propanol-preferring
MTVTMRAMLLAKAQSPLQLTDVPRPTPAPGQLLARVQACGVCRTDLHIVDGELPDPVLPLVLGHEIVATVEEPGAGARRFEPGTRIGIPWLAWACGECVYCRRGQENLCPFARFTGYTVNGGYADFVTADERFCVALPPVYGDAEAAPLLCAGLIGYRALRAAGDARRLGLYGFGASAHIVAQVARHEGRQIFAFTRPGDTASQAFAGSLGAVWAGGSDTAPPEPLDAAIIFAPVGALVPAALRAVDRGGTVVCAGIHMSEIPSFSYDLLWGERVVRSVANLTRRDAEEFMVIAPQVPVHMTISIYRLVHANRALGDLRRGAIEGAAVLVPGRDSREQPAAARAEPETDAPNG